MCGSGECHDRSLRGAPPMFGGSSPSATHYEALLVPHDASPDVMRRQYHRALLLLHPDKRQQHVQCSRAGAGENQEEAGSSQEPQLEAQGSGASSELSGGRAQGSVACHECSGSGPAAEKGSDARDCEREPTPAPPGGWDADEAARERLGRVQEAWVVLQDPHARAAYDLELREGAAVYASVSLQDMERQAQGGPFAYTCRCGGLFQIWEDEVVAELGAHDRTEVSLACPSCSLWLSVHLDREALDKGLVGAGAL